MPVRATFVSQPVGGGVHVHVLPTDRFKTTTVQAFWRQPLTAATASGNALAGAVLRRGTAALPTTLALTRRLQSLYGADLDTDVFKIGETQLLQASLDVPGEAFLPEAPGLLAAALELLGDVLLRPLREGGAFAAATVAQEQTVLQRRIASLMNDKRSYALVRCAQAMCADEPYAVHRYGTPEQVAAETPATTWSRYEAVRDGSPLDLYVVGAVDPAATAQMVAQAFAELTAGPERQLPPPPKAAPPARPVLQEVAEQQQVSQGTFVLGLRTGVDRCDPAYAALQLANCVLGGSAQSKLFVNVREKASLAYFAHSLLEGGKGLMFVTAGIAPENYQKVLDIVQRELAAVQAGDISDEEWAGARSHLLLAARTLGDRPGSLIRHHLEGRVGGCPADPAAWEPALAAVTREQAVAAAAAVRADTAFFLHGPEEGAAD